ncbi:MAG: beta-glucosidase, partial [Clostridia bacterium]|nr:beta-glucosidase [Clostridia bacterium]
MFIFKEFEIKAEHIISQMTLKEKVGQLNQITITSFKDDMDSLKKYIREGNVGSIILASSATAGNDPQGHVNIEFYNELQKIAVEESRMKIPMIYGRD